MEQRIDPNTQPGYAAGTDPAYVPGLTVPAPAVTPESSPEGATPQPEVNPGPVVEPEPEPEPEPQPVAEPVSDAARPGEADGPPADRKEAKDGPAFDVSDRRGSITAGHEGVRFQLDDQEAEFRWDEIAAVEVKLPRFGRRFTVVVHMPNHRWFTAEVDAPAKSRLKEWAEEMDAVLDAYFEES
ncbi:hypothetical protein ACFVWY_13335 [Streptomyces sp. NPDC058195]|uniref:hypothetical protein n=1 Tax=Streptomyces sp. NPDC058195 TaxID=3346375 RepID=UPI0036E1A684